MLYSFGNAILARLSAWTSPTSTSEKEFTLYIKKIVVFLRFYGLGTLLLGLAEKLMKGLIKKAEAFLPRLRGFTENLTTEYTKRQDVLKIKLEELTV